MTITQGQRITVIRTMPGGRQKFRKTGQVLEVRGSLFRFREDAGRDVWLTVDPTEIASVMRGWSQSYA